MLFPGRIHTLKEVSDLEELAELLTEHTWTLCTGFRLVAAGQELLILNDSTSENGAQEYGVFLLDGRQVESVTFGWCTRERASQILRDTLSGRHEQMGVYRLQLDLGRDHSCHLCW